MRELTRQILKSAQIGLILGAVAGAASCRPAAAPSSLPSARTATSHNVNPMVERRSRYNPKR